MRPGRAVTRDTPGDRCVAPSVWAAVYILYNLVSSSYLAFSM